jgi:hypothetical protein
MTRRALVAMASAVRCQASAVRSGWSPGSDCLVTAEEARQPS